jgi:hypothetical protein
MINNILKPVMAKNWTKDEMKILIENYPTHRQRFIGVVT